jgi:hypothetical protein
MGYNCITCLLFNAEALACTLGYNPPTSECLAYKERIRRFPTGATRDTDMDKLDYEGFLSPFALTVYAQYMHNHRKQSDGQYRDSDNWQKGLPISESIKSLWRHFVSVWFGNRTKRIDANDVCGIIFNAFAILHELTVKKGKFTRSYNPETGIIEYGRTQETDG